MIGKKAYVGGGFTDDFKGRFTDLWEFDTEKMSWTRKNDPPFVQVDQRRVLGFSVKGMGYVLNFDFENNQI